MKHLEFISILIPFLFFLNSHQRAPNNLNFSLVEICNNGIDDDDDGLIDCFDDDCICDDCEEFYYNSCPPDSCTGIPDDFEIKEKWRSGGTQSNLNPPVIGDLDGDGLPEILTIGNSSGLQTSPIYSASEILIYSGDGSNKNNPVRITEQLSGNGTNLLLADLNRDGKGEIVFIDISDRLRFFSNYDGNSVTDLNFSVPVQAGLRAAPNAADFNSDGIPEIYVGKEIFGFDANFTSITKLLEGSGNAIGRREIPGRSILPIAPVAGDVLSPADCGGDPDCDGLELICGPEVYSVDLTTADGDGFEIKLQRNADNFSGGQNMQDGAAGLADMNLDGTLEVIVNGAWEQGGTVTYGTYIYSPSNSTIYLRSPSLGNNGSTGSLGKVSIGNVFDDSAAGFSENYPEVIAVCANWIYTINLNRATIPGTNGLWWSMQVQDPSAITGATSFDFNGDSLSEIVYRDEDNLRIMYGGSMPFPPNVDAQRNWTTIAGGSQTGTEHPVVADVDADGTTEIALIAGSSRSTNGTLRIFESANQPWIPSRPVWNQQQYFNVNINDNLTVPPYQQAHQLVGEDLNIFLNQFGDLKYNNEELERSDTIEFCLGDTVFIQGLPPITRAGIAEVNLSNPNGCDSIITYFLVETSDTIFEQRFESICEGETVNVFGMPVATSGIFTQIDSSKSCLKIETVEVEVNTIEITSEEFPPICFGETSGQIEISSNTPNLEYSLNGNAFSVNPVFGNLGAGNYNLAVRNASGCLFETQIEITNPEQFTLSLPNDTLINLGDSILIIPNYSQSPESYVWSPEVYLDCFDCSSVFAKPFQTIIFNLIITDDKGCIATDSMLIRVEAIRNLYAPSAFSPNDDGINDGFTIFGDATMSNIKELKIFDRWGNFIWEGINLLPNDPSLGWDGKFRDKKMDSAVFAFYGVVEFIDGHQEIVKGNVSLLK